MAILRNHKLPSGPAFNRVFRQGKTVKSSFFFIRYLSGQQVKWRAAAVASAKKIKKAAARNNCKRLAGDVLREHGEKIMPVDIIIIFTQPILSKDRKEIKAQLNETIIKYFVNQK